MKNFILIISVVLTCIACIMAINKKSYFHGDEVLSYSIALSETNPFLSGYLNAYNWVGTKDFKKNLTLDNKNYNHFMTTYKNASRDVHPPLYLLLVRFSNWFSLNQFSWMPAYILNLIVTVLCLYLFHLLMIQLHIQEYLHCFSLIFFASNKLVIANFAFLRMYNLLSLFILLFIYFHLKFYNRKNINLKVIFSASLALLTHYYFLFIIFPIYIFQAIKNKHRILIVKESMLIALVATIFNPYMWKHLFSSGRSHEIFEKIKKLDFSFFGGRITDYSQTITELFFDTNKDVSLILFFTCFFIFFIVTLRTETKKTTIISLTVASFFYFSFSASLSPYTHIRYILPICPLIILLFVNMIDIGLKDNLFKYVSTLIMLIIITVKSYPPYAHIPTIHSSSVNPIVKEAKNILIIPNRHFDIVLSAQHILHAEKFFVLKPEDINKIDSIDKEMVIIDFTKKLESNQYKLIEKQYTHNVYLQI